MKNRDRVILYIEQRLTKNSEDGTADDLGDFLGRINAKSSRWGSNRQKWFFVVLALTPAYLLLFSQGPSSPNRFVLPWWIIYIAIVGAVLLLAWLWHTLPERLNLKQVQVHHLCIRCGYSLDGLDSVLGEDVWVGPKLCPESGERYPAIG